MDRKRTALAHRIMITAHKIFAAIFLLTPLSSRALPPEFSASYLAETYGIVAAQAHYKLEHKNNGIVFTQKSSPIGIAALFSDDELKETSLLSMHNGNLLLDEYHFEHKGSDENKDVHLKMQWDTSDKEKISGIISGTTRGKTVKYNVTTAVWDTLSFQIPIMAVSNKNQEYTLLVKGELKKYTFVTHDKETLTIGNNTLDTIKIERKSGNNKKPLYLWIAPSLNNIPVKIEKWKKGKPHITMTLNAATFPSNKNQIFKVEENFDEL